MNFINRYRTAISVVAFFLLYLALYPLYRFIFDDDGIGYLMVARRLATGDYKNAINGYWSPLHSWLIVPLLKSGMNEFTAIKASNAVIGMGIVFYVNRIINKTAIEPGLKTVAVFISVVLSLSFSFFELAADVLLCLLLLVYIDLTLSPGFFEKRGKIILCGVLGALCYFAKTYAFPFFLVHFILLQFILFRQYAQLPKRSAILVSNIFLGIGTFMLLSLPWMFALYSRYHFLTIGYSGDLNLSWRLTPPGTLPSTFFASPSSNGSPCVWEDPYSPQGIAYHSFTSFPIFIRQIRLALDNFMTALSCFNQLCFLSSGIILALFINIFSKKRLPDKIFFLTILLLPAGYILIHIETRFIWVTAFLMLIAGTWILSEYTAFLNFKTRLLIWIVFFGSFLVYPINSLKDSAGNDREVFELARIVKANQVTGKFASNTGYSVVERLAYLTGSSYYTLVKTNYNYPELQQQLQSNTIQYFFFFYENDWEIESFKKTLLYESSTAHIDIAPSKMIILKLF